MTSLKIQCPNCGNIQLTENTILYYEDVSGGTTNPRHDFEFCVWCAHCAGVYPIDFDTKCHSVINNSGVWKDILDRKERSNKCV